VAVVAAVVSAGVLCGTGAEGQPPVAHPVEWSGDIVAAPPPSPPAQLTAVPYIPPVLPQGVAKETGLQVDTIRAARAVSARFPEILDIGGVRSDPLKWHPHGLAIDVMIPNPRSEAGIALGDQVVAYVMENAERLGVVHAIWRQTIYKPDGSARLMADRGGDTANHYDHVHVATDGGGYPKDGQVFLR